MLYRLNRSIGFRLLLLRLRLPCLLQIISLTLTKPQNDQAAKSLQYYNRIYVFSVVFGNCVAMNIFSLPITIKRASFQLSKVKYAACMKISYLIYSKNTDQITRLMQLIRKLSKKLSPFIFCRVCIFCLV